MMRTLDDKVALARRAWHSAQLASGARLREGPHGPGNLGDRSGEGPERAKQRLSVGPAGRCRQRLVLTMC
jgi:hypothetical protein